MPASPFGDHLNPDEAPRSDGLDVEVGIAAFLPEGVELAVGAEGPELVDAAVLEAEEDAGLDGPGAAGVDGTAGSSMGAAELDRLEQDLDAVDAAIARIDAGTYGIDPATGEPIDDDLLAEDPTRLS